VRAGRRFRLTTPRGQQAADFFALADDDPNEWLSPMHTWTWTRSVRPGEGQTFLSNRRNPLVEFVEDGAGGVHDMLLAACDQARYRQLGFDGYHASCAENLALALRALGRELPVTPQPVNFFTNTEVDADQALVARPNPVPAGSYVVLEAVKDLVCAVSSCPFDLDLDGWSINGPEGPTELTVELVQGQA
jgi:uncharacterized protein